MIKNGGKPLRLGFKSSTFRHFTRWLVVEQYSPSSATAGAAYPTNGGANNIHSSPYPYPDRISFNTFWHHQGTNGLYEDGHVTFVRFGKETSNTMGAN